MSKDQISKIISIVVMFAIALLSVFGYNVIVVQPALAELEQQAIEDPFAPNTAALTRAGGYNTLCYREQGGASFACDNGGTFKSNNAPLEFEGATANDYETTVTVTDPTADRTFTLPDISGIPLLTTNAGKVTYGTNTITTTLALAHGLTTPQAAFCTLGTDPSAAQEGNCTVTISGGTVTAKVWKVDGYTVGDSGVTVYWVVAGQP